MAFIQCFMAIVICLLYTSCHAFVTCSTETAAMALDNVIRLEGERTDWRDVYESYRKFRQCDDGAIASGYDDVVVRLLIKKWSETNVLFTLVQKDKHFGDFVLHHIGETAPQGSLEQIRKNAAMNCATTAKAFCRSIVSQIDTVQEDLHKK